MLRVALAQINTIVGDLTGNCRKIKDYVQKAKDSQADLVVFPEMAVTGYPPEDLLHKEHFVKDNIQALKILTKDIEQITAVIGFVDLDQKKNIYNAAAVVSDSRIRGIYHKKELPNYGVFDEKRYFTEGRENPLFILNQHVFGVHVCEDIWQDAVPRDQAQSGARLLINVSSSPYDFGKLEQRERLLKERAKQNKITVCYANLVGGQDELVFDGGSLIVDDKGKTLASGKLFEEDLVVADLALSPAKKKPRSRKLVALPSTKDQQEKNKLDKHICERYSPIERIHKALVLGTHDYIVKNGFKKAVIGLSGGIDSSLVAALATQAIGKENVIGVSMPSKYTSEETRTDARQVAQNMGIRFIEVPIQELFETYLSAVKEEFTGQQFGVAEENLQARIRGNILMTFSNKFGWLVLTTGNKSEVAVGYCTLYGDMTGGFAVIKDVPKTKVYEIARLINSQNSGWIPESILNRAPSAELRENQKDEDSLPPYEKLDQILKLYVEEHRSLSQMKNKNHAEKLIREIISLVDRSEYKRRQSPPGIKITPRAFGKDWRLPITNRYKEF